jgi:hypothetical protein
MSDEPKRRTRGWIWWTVALVAALTIYVLLLLNGGMSDEPKMTGPRYVPWFVAGAALGFCVGFSLFSGPDPLPFWVHPSIFGMGGGILGLIIAHLRSRRRP